MCLGIKKQNKEELLMKKTGLLLCILTLCCIASCFINPDRYKCSWTSPENVQFRAVQKLKHQIDTAKMKEPSFLMVLTGGQYAYRREDGVYVVPIGCLRP